MPKFYGFKSRSLGHCEDITICFGVTNENDICGVCGTNGEEENAYRILVGKPERLFSLKTFEVDGKIN